MRIIPNVSPKWFSLSAVAVGYLLIDDMSATEQNALGNWLMLVAQVLCTNAYYKQLQVEREGQNAPSDEETLVVMQKMMDALYREIEELKREMKQNGEPR